MGFATLVSRPSLKMGELRQNADTGAQIKHTRPHHIELEIIGQIVGVKWALPYLLLLSPPS